MKKYIAKHSIYFIILTAWVIVGSVILLTTEKLELHQNLTSCRSDFWDHFFKILTYTGSGLGALCTLIVIISIKSIRKYWSVFILSYGLSIGLVTLSKQVIFPNTYRPSMAFEQKGMTVPKIENFKMHKKRSFPSGHTAEMFCCFGLFMLISKRKTVQVLLFSMALVAAYSRVYLFQHFFTDIFAGSLLSLLILSIVFYILQGIKTTN